MPALTPIRRDQNDAQRQPVPEVPGGKLGTQWSPDLVVVSKQAQRVLQRDRK